ncbi:hypothetical protein SBRY_60079 [Actinacidiphila bryophytorum]|uniref:Uncharacterized protein n=1 Tax=Actinacidiphila bryophytorum TaxID=1436133 RepID=A0A9W4MEE3_9ACTN|nr:hypothetical protein SBRY_60079 [Actinacidiphila bryophytorum]
MPGASPASEPTCRWSACRWETRTRSAAAAAGGGTGPRRRRRWARRLANSGSVSTRIPESRTVTVAWPHHVISTATVPVPPPIPARAHPRSRGSARARRPRAYSFRCRSGRTGVAGWGGASAGRESETGREAQCAAGRRTGARGVDGGDGHPGAAGVAAAGLPYRVARRRQPDADSGDRGYRRGRLRCAERAGVAAAGQGAAAGARSGAGRAGVLPERFAAAGRAELHPERQGRGRAGDGRGDRRGDVGRVVGDQHRAGRTRRRRLRAAAGPARRSAPQARGRPAAAHGAWHGLPAARRCRPRRAAVRADRQTARDAHPRGLARQHPPAHRVAHRLEQPDRREPAGDPARQQPRRARLPLVREGDRAGDGLQPAVECGGAGAQGGRPHRFARPARRGRRQPRQPVHRGRGPVGAGDVGGGAARQVQPVQVRLLRLLLRPGQRGAHRLVLRRRGRPGGRGVQRVAVAQGPPADQARRPLPGAARLRHRRGAGRGGGRGRRRHARRAHRGLRRPGRLRRGGPPLGTRQPGRPQGPQPARPLGPADRRRGALRPAPVPHRAALRPRAERRRDVRGRVRHGPARAGAHRVRAAACRAGTGAAGQAAHRGGGAGRGTQCAAPAGEGPAGRGGGGLRGAAVRPDRAGVGQPRPGLLPRHRGAGHAGGDRQALPRPAARAHRAPGDRLRARTQRAARPAGARPRRRRTGAGHRAGDRRPRPAGPLRRGRGGRGAAGGRLPAHRRPDGELGGRPGHGGRARLRGAGGLARRPRRPAVPALPAGTRGTAAAGAGDRRGRVAVQGLLLLARPRPRSRPGPAPGGGPTPAPRPVAYVPAPLTLPRQGRSGGSVRRWRRRRAPDRCRPSPRPRARPGAGRRRRPRRCWRRGRAGSARAAWRPWRPGSRRGGWTWGCRRVPG